MGFFDFLKPKHSAIIAAPVISGREECDISKTRMVAKLLQIPRDERDDSWRKTFFDNVTTASFACGSPQTLTGPDGFTYFILNTPEPDKPFESFCLQNMKDDFLLNRGWGVVFNPKADKSADWVFTYGNIVNLHLNSEFFSATEEAATENIDFNKNVGVIRKAEQVLVAFPSESYLPAATRNALKIFMQAKGVKTPKIMMLTSGAEGKLTRKLALNIYPEDLPATTNIDYLMQQIGWFLPNNYLLVSLPKNSELAADFYTI